MRILRENEKRRLILILVLGAAGLLWYRYFRGPATNSGVDMMEERVEGLTVSKRQFFLNKKPFRILSGAMHYFRVPQEYWEDRMVKMKACGLNTLETYVAWNLHEPVPGKFNYNGMLNIREYIELAYKMGLYVILRPGPYICSEWDFGGLPSWLLADRKMRVRSNYPGYQKAVERFLGDLLPRVADLQFKQGGPIIAVQVENEFGSFSSEVAHLKFIKEVFVQHRISELLVTSDGADGFRNAPFHSEAFPTANFKEVPKGVDHFKAIQQVNKDFPLMVMEFWTGWFDHWGSPHNTDAVDKYADSVTNILKMGASINFYMFHGGTNFGFMAGANEFKHYKPDVTSYDYDAPLSEAGDITEKYVRTREIIMTRIYKPLGINKLPTIPLDTPKKAYGKLKMEAHMDWDDLTSLITKRATSDGVQPMEMYQFADGVGQAYGYIIYRGEIGRGKSLELPGKVRDRAQVLLNSQLVTTFDHESKSLQVDLKVTSPQNQLDIMVENLGRVNFAKHSMQDTNILSQQRKGLEGDMKLDGKVVKHWQALALDFDGDFLHRVSSASQWKTSGAPKTAPTLYRASLTLNEAPKDTFVSMKGWKKGIVIVNGVNLGRYWDIGPQRTLFLPAPFLRQGKNEILVFEEFSAEKYMFFEAQPQLG